MLSNTALAHFTVSLFPCRSFVLFSLFTKVFSIEFSMLFDASCSPKKSNIIAPDQIWPIGFAIPLPAISGADPWTGSNNDGNFLSGFMFPDGAIPIVPVHAGPKSDKISPNKFEATTQIYLEIFYQI